MDKSPTLEPKSSPDVKTSKHAGRYLFIGIAITVFNFGLYSLLTNIIIKNNDLLWLSTFISTAITTIVAYIAHSKFTWKERNVTKHSIIKFFIWNALLAVAIGPGLTQLFSLLTPLYEFAYNISSTLHLPFTYEFVLTTGAFVLTAAVTMILNFLFYDKFVFGKSNPTKSKPDQPNLTKSNTDQPNTGQPNPTKPKSNSNTPTKPNPTSSSASDKRK